MTTRFRTIPEQVDILLDWGIRSSEGLARDELRRKIIPRLELISPYRLTSYWNLYRHRKEEGCEIHLLDYFRADTYWEDICALYMFD